MPFDDASFDIVFSEYGASIWCDPYVWIPEAARVLRPGGQLAFLANAAIAMLCSPDAQEPPGATLLRPYFGMHRFTWSDDDSAGPRERATPPLPHPADSRMGAAVAHRRDLEGAPGLLVLRPTAYI
jgi:SAM-dependent methyltransferase